MKTMTKYALLVAVAAMGFTACSKDEIDEIKNEPTFTLSIEASADETRSSFGDLADNAYLSNWSGTENVYFYMGEDTQGVQATPSAAGLSATFDVTFSGTAPASGTIYALSPVGDYNSTPKKGGFTSNKLNSNYSDSYVVIPAVQTPLEGSCDESVHLLAATQEFTGTLESPLKMHFRHAAAYGRMTITNFAGTIKSVAITSPVAIVGDGCYYYYKTGELTHADVNTLTLNADNVVDNVFWFGCAPAELTSGEMTVTVTDSDDKRYVKKISLSADHGIKLIQGRIASFSVNMKDIEPEIIVGGANASLSRDEIINHFKVHKYADAAESYVDTDDNVTWTFCGSKDNASRPWLQIKKDNNAYIKIEVTANIKTVTITISNTNNSSGGIADITKHGQFTGTIHLKTGSTTGTDVGSGNDSDQDNKITIDVTSDCTALYITSSAAARIWGVDITTE